MFADEVARIVAMSPMVAPRRAPDKPIPAIIRSRLRLWPSRSLVACADALRGLVVKTLRVIQLAA